MDNTVEYILNLRDNLSTGLGGADTRAKELESTLGGIKGVLESIGIVVGAYAAFEWIKEATKDSGDLKIAQEQIKTGLESTKNAAGLTFEGITKSTEELFHSSNFTKAQLADMQAIMVTFPNITQRSFGASSQIIADMAQRMHQDLKQTAVQVGKALQDPVKGAMALHRVGVNISEQQKEAIKQLVSEGKNYEAQQVIMTELNTEFAGSAKSAFNALPLASFGKTMEDVKESVGDFVLEIETSLGPVINSLGTGIMKTITFLKENKNIIELLGGAFLVYKGILIGTTIVQGIQTSMALQQALAGTVLTTAQALGAVATSTFTGAVWALNAAWAANPVGIVIAGIALLVAGVMYAWNHFEGFRKVVLVVWGVLKAFGIGVGGVFYGLGEVIAGALTLNPNLISKGLSDTVSAVKGAVKDISEAGKTGTEEGAKSYWRDHGVGKTLIPGKPGGAGKPGGDGANAPTPKTKAEGQKTINIHVAYNAPLMSGGITISTTNLHEGAGKIKEILTEMLVGATHDTLMVADY